MNRAIYFLMGIGLILLLGCQDSCDSSGQAKQPRAVATIELARTQPAHEQAMTGVVDSWKTEQIGFEVAGRVVQVVEPNTEVEARVIEPENGEILAIGTAIARLDDQRYRIAAVTAEAALNVAKRRLETIQIEIDEGIPARRSAAEAEQKRAQDEFDRLSRLMTTNAVSQSEFDRARAALETASANVATIEAELSAKQAEYRAVAAEVEQAKLQLERAELDRQDTILYSPFSGQVAKVHVTPGSYVSIGQPAVTLQMMDPMKVKLEASAALSRKFHYGDMVRLIASDGRGQPVELTGLVYRTDPVADPQTRTFTVTLLVRNQRDELEVPEQMSGQSVARTRHIWPVNVGAIVGGDSTVMVEADAIRHDAAGAFIWKVTNRHIGEVTGPKSRVLHVTKVRVTPGRVQIPFLGNWKFVPVTVNEGESFDPDRDLIAGKIFVDGDDGDSWDGDQVLLDRSCWLLRPGDLIRVVMPNSDIRPGYYVPMRAIRHEAGRTFVFVVDDDRACRMEVRVTEDVHSVAGSDVLRRIEPLDGAGFAPGTRLIVEGVHYLTDGEPVVAVDRMEDVQ